MKSDQLDDLKNLTDALYRVEQQKLAKLSAKESELRQKLSELEQHRRNNTSLPANEFLGLREIGADVLWQGWVIRTRQNLMVELAQVLAQKAGMRPALQRAFGKQMASAQIHADEKTRHLQNQRFHDEQSVEKLNIFAAQKSRLKG